MPQETHSPRHDSPRHDHPDPVSVVVVPANPALRDAAVASLGESRHDWTEAPDLEAAIALLHEHVFDVCLVCDAIDGPLANRARSAWPRLRRGTQLVLALPDEPHAPVAEYAFVVAPWTTRRFDHVLGTAARYAHLVEENASLRSRLVRQTRQFVESRNARVVELRAECTRAAESLQDVVLHGEPGSLLENWARLVHETGPRAAAPFVRLDGRTLTTDAFEQEFRPGGRIERAAGGTVFVDHVDEASEPIRTKLRHRRPSLRIADSNDWPTQFVVGWHGAGAATTPHGSINCDPATGDAIVEGAWALVVPPLARRREDLHEIAGRFLDDVATRLGEPPKQLDPAARDLLAAHDWPRNEVELLGVLENAFTGESGHTLTAENLRGWIGSDTDTFDDLGVLPLRTMERRLIEATFERCDGNRERTAKSLGIGIRTLSGKLREYGYPPRGGPGSNRLRIREAA